MLYYHKDLETIADVKEFFKWLLDEGINFHPEDDFKNYINVETKEPSFSPEVVDELNGLMDQAWSICEKFGLNCCEVACEIALQQGASLF